jgi:NADH:ubiquinone oxidoreductase subunit C
MRCDLLGFVRFVFSRSVLLFSESSAAKNKTVFLHVGRRSLRALLALVRLQTLVFGTHLLDVTGFEQAANGAQSGAAVSVVYVFYAARWSFKLVICTHSHSWSRVASLGEFFGGAVWPERECAELLGVNFAQKLDARRLMLDYTFEGAPLLKKFPAVGYEELEYNSLVRGMLYSMLRLRDEAEVAGA